MDDSPASVSDSEETLDIYALRRQQKQKEQVSYQGAAIAASVGVSFLAIAATVVRFQWHAEVDGDVPVAEVAATLLLVLGGVFGESLTSHEYSSSATDPPDPPLQAWRCGLDMLTSRCGTITSQVGHFTSLTTSPELAHLKTTTFLRWSMASLP